MPRRILLSVLAALLLALAPAGARAADHDFLVAPDPPNQGQETAFILQGPTADVERVRWDLDGDGELDDGEGLAVSHVYTARGPVTVRMRVDEERGPPERVTKGLVVNGAPSVDFGFTPGAPLTGEEVAFSATVSDPEDDPVSYEWSFGDGASSTALSPAHAYTAAGTFPVTLIVTDEHGATGFSSETVTVSESPGPATAFTYTPASPFTAQLVEFTSTSTAGAGSITNLEWDLDGDGEFDDATGGSAQRAFSLPGTHVVLLRATQTDGKRSVAVADVPVRQRATSGSPGAAPGGIGTSTPLPPGTATLTPMRPFPVVRIAGVVLTRGVRLRILSVRGPIGAAIRVLCRGRGCPTRSVRRTSRRRVIRVRAFERRLPAGVRLHVFVRQPGRIGKYTRFLIRAGSAPARLDRCLLPGRRVPVRCP